jgi:predicted metal-dependent peptidase
MDMETSVINERLARASAQLTRRWPMFAPALSSLSIEFSDQIPIAAIYLDGTLLLNRDAVQALSDKELSAVLAHELLHIKAAHFERAAKLVNDEVSMTIWRIAADLEVNDELAYDYWAIVDVGGLVPAHYGFPGRLPAEEYYRMLSDIARDMAGLPAASQAGQAVAQDGDDDGQSAGQSSGQSSGQDGRPGRRSGKNGKRRSGRQPDGESIKERLERVGISTPRVGGGDVDGSQARNSSENARSRRPLAAAARFRQIARQIAGRLPAGSQAGNEVIELETKPDPAVELVNVLRAFLPRGDGAMRRTYLRPSRRFIHTGIIRPSWTDDTGGKIVVILDTSGSMRAYSARLQHAANILAGLSQELKNITLIECDAEVNRIHENWNGELPRVYGGGGTVLAEAFIYINENDLRPDAVVVLTDGDDAGWPARVPDYPVIAGLVWRDGIAPEWAHVVQLDCD